MSACRLDRCLPRWACRGPRRWEPGPAPRWCRATTRPAAAKCACRAAPSGWAIRPGRTPRAWHRGHRRRRRRFAHHPRAAGVRRTGHSSSGRRHHHSCSKEHAASFLPRGALGRPAPHRNFLGRSSSVWLESGGRPVGTPSRPESGPIWPRSWRPLNGRVTSAPRRSVEALHASPCLRGWTSMPPNGGAENAPFANRCDLLIIPVDGSVPRRARGWEGTQMTLFVRRAHGVVVVGALSVSA